MSTQQQYEDYLQGFTKYLDKLSDKLAMFTYLKEKPVGDEVELAPVIFLPIIESLLVDSVISLAKLYESNSDRNLNKFLSFVESNRSNLVWRREPITLQQINTQRQLIVSNQTAIDHVLTQRNKYFAHHDKEYFVDSTRLSDNYPLSIDDVKKLICTAQEINNEHSFALTGSMPITLQNFCVVALDNMFQVLRNHQNLPKI